MCEHGRAVSADAERRWLSVALGLVVCLLVGDVAVGLLAGSLAVLSDAAHMLTDAGSLVLALGAARLAVRPATGDYTFGWKRAEVLAALGNGVVLLVLAGVLAWEAVERMRDPRPVAAGAVVVTALAGVAVDAVITWCIARADRSSVNVEGAFQHFLTDLFGHLATAVAGVVILFTGFLRADAVASLVVVVLMMRAGVVLVRSCGRIILEAAPRGIQPRVIGERLAADADVVEVHDLHVWQIDSRHAALAAHVLIAPGGNCHAVRRRLEGVLEQSWAITHTTLQVDHAAERLLTIAARPPAVAGPRCLIPGDVLGTGGPPRARV